MNAMEPGQLYPIPQNWRWIHLLDSFENHTDSKKKVQRQKYLENGKLAVVDQGQELVGGYTDDESMAYSGELPIVIFGDHTRCIKYIDFPFAQGADGVKVLSPKSFYDVRAFYFALQTIEIPNMGYRRHYPLFPQFRIPVPPLPEQQRIVTRIESLFTKLDEAKEKAQAVVDGFELRKSAILHKAFTGELTKKWRKKHGVGLDSWVRQKLKDCGKWCGGGTPSMTHPEYWSKGNLLWITSKDMKTDVIDDTLMHTNMTGVENSSANYIKEPSVLFVMRSGILRRTLPIAMVKIPFTVNQDLKAVSPVDDLNLEYFFWACKRAEKRILDTCMKSGTTVESINAKSLMEFEIPIASQPEQKEIVSCITNLLEREQQAKKAAEAVLAQIDVMKKAILARAFRGELGTNDPAEPPPHLPEEQ